MPQLKLTNVNQCAEMQALVEAHLNRVKWNMWHSGDRKLAPNEFRISSIGYPSRWLYYERVCPEQKIIEINEHDDNIASAVLPGTATHEVFQKYDPQALIPEETTVHFDNGKIKLSGHIDQDKLHPDLDVDYKTAKSLYFIKKKGRASETHIHQSNTYAYLEGKGYQSIAYLDKITYKHLVFVYPTSETMFQKDIARLEMILGHVSRKEAPACDGEDYFCGFCPFRRICEVCKK